MEKFSLAHLKQLKQKNRKSIARLAHTLPHRKREVYSLPRYDGTRPVCIAEVKKASPSEGHIRHVSPAGQAEVYMSGGASAVSVLVDDIYFSGSFDDLDAVSTRVQAPVLCKEFVCTPEQVKAAWLAGADLVLLIVKMLEDDELAELYSQVASLGMTPLVEIHHESELERVQPLSPSTIMVNMRNLDTLNIDMDTGMQALRAIPSSIQKISASGIQGREDIQRVIEHTGTGTFLVGTALMKSENPRQLLEELTSVR
ncbi:MAG: indole-3-glycerol-phosphate synthase [Spirochaetota bacterium]